MARELMTTLSVVLGVIFAIVIALGVGAAIASGNVNPDLLIGVVFMVGAYALIKLACAACYWSRLRFIARQEQQLGVSFDDDLKGMERVPNMGSDMLLMGNDWFVVNVTGFHRRCVDSMGPMRLRRRRGNPSAYDLTVRMGNGRKKSVCSMFGVDLLLLCVWFKDYEMAGRMVHDDAFCKKFSIRRRGGGIANFLQIGRAHV